MTNIGVSKEEALKIVYKFINGEDPINKVEKYVIGKLLPDKILDKNEPMNWYEAKTVGKLPNPYSESPYEGRCYSLFGVLAGVRDHMRDPIDLPRYIPDDTTDEIRSNFEDWGYDAHSASYYYLYELLDSPYRKMSRQELEEDGIDPFFFKEMLDGALKIVEDPRDLRFIFWFDN